MPLDKSNSDLNGLGGLPNITSSSGSSNNPLSTSNELQLKVSGIGSMLGLNWGTVTVAQAIKGFEQLAKTAAGKGQGAATAKNQLAQVQQLMFVAGYYGSKQPKYGTLSTLDTSAFEKAAVGSAQSGQNFSDYITTQANQAQSQGTSGGGTHIIPASRIQEKVWTTNDVLAAINAATSATGSDLAQRLVGREFTQQELQGAADALNASQAQQTQADVAGVEAQQQQDVQTSQAVYGTAPANTVLPPGGKVNAQQVYTQVLAAGGSVMQAQVGAALVSGIESNGDPTELAGGVGPAAGLFQFEPGTWRANGGSAYGSVAQDATWQQQVAVFVNATKGNHFGAWGPDLVANSGNPNSPTNSAYGYAGAPQPGSKVGNWLAQNGASLQGGTTTPTTQPQVNNQASVASPVGKGLKQGRTDQGVDYSGKGGVFAVGAGTITSVTAAGWPGGVFIALKLDHPSDPDHSVVYYAEDLTPQVKIGQHVGAGRQIAMANGGKSGIEIGWADPSTPGRALAASKGQYTRDGVVTPEGQNFLNYIKSPAAAKLTGTDLSNTAATGVAAGGANGQTTDIYQAPVVDQVPATIDPTQAATIYAEQKLSPEYQANNLLKVFQMIQDKIGTKATPSGNVSVRNTPVTMT